MFSLGSFYMYQDRKYKNNIFENFLFFIRVTNEKRVFACITI